MLVTTGEGELDEEGTALLTLRDHLFAIAQNREEPINQRIEQILSACGAHVPDVPLAQWAEFLSLARAYGRGVDGHFWKRCASTQMSCRSTILPRT